MTTLADRLRARLVEMPSGCLEWSGYCTKAGYGQVGSGGKLLSTHVVAWTLANGPVPAGLWVLHRCDNPPCCRPEHLFVGTAQDNVDDMHAKGRARKAQGIEASHGRLTRGQVDDLLSRHVPGRPAGHGVRTGNTAALAAEFGITPQYIGQLRRRVWRKHA
jgi:hypothetical protein